MKKFLKIAFALLLVVGIAGCGSNKKAATDQK